MSVGRSSPSRYARAGACRNAIADSQPSTRLHGSSEVSSFGRRTLPTLILLFALLWQSLVLQSHVHSALLAGAVHDDHAGATHRSVGAPAPGDDPAICPICRMAAQSGHYLSPAPLTVLLSRTTPFAFSDVIFTAWPGRHVPSGWYGRGPPISRHAD